MRASRVRRPGVAASAARLLWLLGLLGLGLARADVPLDRLEPGLEGYALTAGAGNRIERFPIEILALQYDIVPGFPLVLVRASGAFIETSGGVAAGMSGSPVYLEIDGRDELLGAIGYVFPSSDHRLALVTPIGAMRASAGLEGTDVAPFGAAALAGLGPASPVATPVLMSGLSDRATQLLSPLFERAAVTLLPVQGGPVPSDEEEAYRLEPGSAISVQLVRGDVTLAAIGTLTAIEDGHALAFGHPLLGEGEVSFALAPAFISHIVPSSVVPFKLANSGRRLLGTISQDRPAAISGPLDQEPELIEVSLTLSGSPLSGPSATRRFEVTRDERYYAPLVAAATLELIDEALGRTTAGTSEVAWEITLQGDERVNVLEQVSVEDDIALATARLTGEPLAILADNVFAPAAITRLAVNIDLWDEQRVAELVDVKADQERLDPGGTATLFVRLQPYRQEARVETLRVELPEGVGDEVTLTVRGGLTPREDERSDLEREEDEPPLLSFDELLVGLRENLQASELVVETVVDGETRRLERLVFPFLIRGSESVTIPIGEEAPSGGEVGDPAGDPLDSTPEPEPEGPDEPAPPGPDGQPPLEES